MRIQSLIVATDFSKYSRWAGDAACMIAERTGAKVHFIHAIRPWETYSATDLYATELARDYQAALMETGQRAMGRFIKRFERVPGVSSEVVLETPHQAIARAIKSRKADLVVCGHQGAGPFRRFFIGSTALALVRKATVPVLVAQKPWEDSAIGNPVVAVDLSLRSVEGLRWGAAFAKLFGTKVIAAHVLDENLTVVSKTKMKDLLERMVKSFLADNEDVGIKRVSVEVSVAKETVTGLEDLAGLVGSHLVVATSQGHTGAAGFTLGSFCEKLLRDARVPVLVVPNWERPARK